MPPHALVSSSSQIRSSLASLCGLASLSVVLNALAIDPGRPWKGPWRCQTACSGRALLTGTRRTLSCGIASRCSTALSRRPTSGSAPRAPPRRP
ncbi:glutathione gamma-glutamylcysteinyltransferase 1 [Hordeum vulgare]|nr:glutathione gamma-glutamylcysteinyltransferase 1 [Hordeum vulgare]